VSDSGRREVGGGGGSGAYVSFCKLKEKWNCQVQGVSTGKLPSSSENVTPI
jgi:hypothetical protein